MTRLPISTPAWTGLLLATLGLVFLPAVSKHTQHAQTTPGPYMTTAAWSTTGYDELHLYCQAVAADHCVGDVNFTTANGTATAGVDYNATSGTLVFGPGETSRTVIVVVRGDRTREADETFSVNLSGATGGIVADAQGAGTTRNDDR